MKRVLSILLVLMLVFVVVACGGAEEPEEPEEEPAEEPEEEEEEEEEEPEEEEEEEEEEEDTGSDKKDWVIALETDIVQFDPHQIGDATTSSVAGMIFEQLMARDHDGEPIPCLAEDWEVSDDGLEWTFYLREGVEFHDGSPFNAEVVEWHFGRGLTDESNFQAQFEIIDEIEVVDDYTVTFHLKEPMAAFPDNVIMPNGGFIPSMESFEEKEYEDFIMEPIGTGPWMWDEWVQGQRVELTKNPDWWDEQPKIDTLVYKIIPEANTQVIELETGGVDLIIRASEQDIERFEENPDFNVITKAAYRSRQYELNVEKFPFDDKRVREAVNWAIDMPSIVEAVARPLAVPSDSLLPAAGWGYPGEDVLPNYGYDPDKARELLEEAGFTLNDDDIYEKDGEPLSITITCPDNRYYMDKQMSEVVLNQLGEVGIEADLKVMEWGAFLDEVRPGNFQMTFLGWNQSGADPSLFLDAKVMTDGRGNYANHSDPELDEILKEAQKTTDMDERKELYEEAQVIVNEHAWHVFIDNESLVWIFPDNVKGFEPGPANQSDFWYTKLHFE